MGTKRRSFLKSAAFGMTTTTAAAKVMGQQKSPEKARSTANGNPESTGDAASGSDKASAVSGYKYQLPNLPHGATLLFQGDSITDMKWGRNQNDRNHYLGHSYVFLIAARLNVELPAANFNFLNRGMSGHTVIDLQKRWQKDAIDLKPDLLTILVGINDVGRAVRSNKDVNPEAYEEGYRDLLNRSRTANPSLRLVLIEPFALPVTRDWRSQVERIRPVVAKLAREFDAVHVPMQEIFNEVSQNANPEHWIWDGVHPLPQGHELIARHWIERVAAAFPA